MTLAADLGDAGPVKMPETPTTILLDQAVDLMFEIYLMRGDCCLAAQALLSEQPVDQAAVEDCARLDDTLAKTYRSLQATVRAIQRRRSRR